jgi:SAM-dependent methyltransferase
MRIINEVKFWIKGVFFRKNKKRSEFHFGRNIIKEKIKNFKRLVQKDGKKISKNEKKLAELKYWKNLVEELTQNCRTSAQKEEKLLNICYEITNPRYKKDLYLEDDSFYGKKVLDVGCGPHGGLIGFKNCEKYGVDHLINEYKKLGYPLDKHDIKYFQAKSEQMPFSDSFIDIIVCVNALDHVDDLEKTIKEISRILKEGGRFLAQINFRSISTATEPIILDHKKLKRLLLKNNLILIRKIFQYEIAHEKRYYYECEKK